MLNSFIGMAEAAAWRIWKREDLEEGGCPVAVGVMVPGVTSRPDGSHGVTLSVASSTSFDSCLFSGSLVVPQ